MLMVNKSWHLLLLSPLEIKLQLRKIIAVVDFFGYRAEFQSDFESIVQERMKMLELMPKAQDEVKKYEA